jgi:hypothetical protein
VKIDLLCTEDIIFKYSAVHLLLSGIYLDYFYPAFNKQVRTPLTPSQKKKEGGRGTNGAPAWFAELSK